VELPKKSRVFFDICKARGLTGEHGVVIPVQNIDDLMLKEEVLDAVKEGKFHIYAVRNIEEGIEILSGVVAGKIREDGTYPEGSVMYFVEQKLKEYNEESSIAEIEEPCCLT